MCVAIYIQRESPCQNPKRHRFRQVLLTVKPIRKHQTVTRMRKNLSIAPSYSGQNLLETTVFYPSSEGWKVCLKWESREVKKVWFSPFIRIPWGTWWFTFRESLYWYFCPVCDTQGVITRLEKQKAETKQAWLRDIVCKPEEEMQNFTTYKTKAKLPAGNRDAEAPATATELLAGVIPLQFPFSSQGKGLRKLCSDLAGCHCLREWPMVISEFGFHQ